MLIDLNCPVENLKTIVKTSSDAQEPYLLLKLLNISDKIITSVDLEVTIFDESGNKIVSIPVELTDLNAQPKEFFAQNKAIALDELYDEKQISVLVQKVVFENDDVPYEFSEENLIDYDNTEASLNDAMNIRELFPDAVCFAEEKENYWRCPCGRPNATDADTCVRCGSEKEDVLKKFASKSSLNIAIKEKEESDKIKAEEEAKALALKKKKLKKNIIIACISVAVIVALIFTVPLIYGAINKSLKNKKAENYIAEGNYLEAYKIYCEIESDKKYEIQENVMGNTPENLFLGLGYSAEDNENLYFISYDSSTQYSNLIKENKKTKEKTVLTDNAKSNLNIVGDYIYFLDQESKPSRMTKDGKKIDKLTDDLAYYMCVVGCDMYYIKLDFDNPNNLPYEQCMALVSSGEMKYYIRLYRMHLETKESVLVSEEEMNACSIYGNRIYYVSASSENTAETSFLKSMDMNGGDIKTHISEPVYMFTVRGDEIFYIPSSSDAADGIQTDYSIKKLNTKTNDVSIVSAENDLVSYMGMAGDKLVYLSFDRMKYMEYASGVDSAASAPVPALITLDINSNTSKIIMNIPISSFNICGDDIICIGSSSVVRIKTDGSDCTPVYADGTSNPPQQSETELSPDLQELLDSMN